MIGGRRYGWRRLDGHTSSFDPLGSAEALKVSKGVLEELRVAANRANCPGGGERFAIVDELAPVRFLSRAEFESLKKFNPKLIEMRAGDILYLTEPPSER